MKECRFSICCLVLVLFRFHWHFSTQVVDGRLQPKSFSEREVDGLRDEFAVSPVLLWIFDGHSLLCLSQNFQPVLQRQSHFLVFERCCVVVATWRGTAGCHSDPLRVIRQVFYWWLAPPPWVHTWAPCGHWVKIRLRITVSGAFDASVSSSVTWAIL